MSNPEELHLRDEIKRAWTAAAHYLPVSRIAEVNALIDRLHAVPNGYALVPLRMTRVMRETVEEEGWEWKDLLAAADAITAEQYNDECSDTVAADWFNTVVQLERMASAAMHQSPADQRNILEDIAERLSKLTYRATPAAPAKVVVTPAAPVIDTCQHGHKFAKLPDHPRRDGVARCPHCLAIGLDRDRASAAPHPTKQPCIRIEGRGVIVPNVYNGRAGDPVPFGARQPDALDIIEMLCNGIQWNIENHPEVMNESDNEALQQAREFVAKARAAQEAGK